MIEVKGIVNGTWGYQDFVLTVEEVIKEDYKYWKTYHRTFILIYKEQLLNRLDDDCSFSEETEWLKEQMAKIDENEIERYKYEN